MLKAGELRVRLEPYVTGLHARSYRSIQNFARHSKRLVLSLVTHVRWNEKSTGAIRHESDPNTPNDKSFSEPFSIRGPVPTGEPLRIVLRLQDLFGKIHRQSDIYASLVKKNNPIKANMLLGSQAAAQGGSAPLWPREMQNAERTQ